MKLHKKNGLVTVNHHEANTIFVIRSGHLRM